MTDRKIVYQKRTLKDLTLKDNFLFAAVMSYPDNCKELLQIILNVEIDHVEVDYEKSIITHPEYHSIRLDVYVKDEHNTRYDIEMQVASQNLEKRTRYYHSQMDRDILSKSASYEELPDSYVIFICDFDPFGKGKYCYTVQKAFQESPECIFDDGSYTIFLSTYGTNRDDVSKELLEFLEYVKNGKESQADEDESEFMRNIRGTIARIQRDHTWGERFMLLEVLLEHERREAYEKGRAEGRAEEGKRSTKASIAMLRECIIDIAEAKGVDQSVIADVESCEDVEKLRSLRRSLLKN